MLRIVHQVCCDIDVQKKFVIATIAFTNGKNIPDKKTDKHDSLWLADLHNTVLLLEAFFS